jgi:phasin family protein
MQDKMMENFNEQTRQFLEPMRKLNSMMLDNMEKMTQQQLEAMKRYSQMGTERMRTEFKNQLEALFTEAGQQMTDQAQKAGGSAAKSGPAKATSKSSTGNKS